MKPSNKKITLLCLPVFLALAVGARVSAEPKIVDIAFAQPPVSGSDTSRTLQSLTKVQGTGIFTQDGLYLLTHCGDRAEAFARENQGLMDNPLLNRTWRHCTVYAAGAGDTAIMGRNWDNQTVGSIVVNLYHPPGGYASISFSRSIDCDFGHKNLERIKTSPLGNKLLVAPFHTTDGMNECGLAVACAAVGETTVEHTGKREPVFILYLMRKILDQAGTVEEAAALVEHYVPFDIDQHTLCTHLMVADSTGRSAVLEYVEGEWKKTEAERPWQVMSTKPIYGVAETDLRERCWRYQGVSETLDSTGGKADWLGSMGVLRKVAQKGTAWSVVYSLAERELYFSVYQDWDTVYRLGFPGASRPALPDRAGP